MNFRNFFEKANPGSQHYPYQEALASTSEFPELLNIPTGLGKTAAVVLSWLYRRREHPDSTVRKATPRRLVYCLPMRVLAQQTSRAAKKWLNNLGLVDQVNVHLLMGGEDDGGWEDYPERDAILIGTQDMLLSRALNRGYGMSRYKWPLHFGLLNNDCLWVMDEVQIMGSGLVTTAQLAAFSNKLWPQIRPCSFLWMSATLGESFLKTRDREDWQIGTKAALSLDKVDLKNQEISKRQRASKKVRLIQDQPKAAQIIDEHSPGRLSLVVVNTIATAKVVFSNLTDEAESRTVKKRTPQPRICLLHSRFRAPDRSRQMDIIEAFIAQIDHKSGAAPNDPGLILVSTQIVEAGFDISSVRLWSEMAPWASVVQRLGRLNREGLQPDATAVFWMPKEEKDGENYKDSPNAKRIGPYEKGVLDKARRLLETVVDYANGGMPYRESLDKVIDSEQGQQCLQFEPDVVIRPDDFHELFSTEADLAGGFTNVAQFVRDSDPNSDLQVFWREIDAKRPPKRDEPKPGSDELCAVPFFDLKRLLGTKGVSWEWSYETGSWERRRAAEVQAGMTLLVPRSAGGYSDDLGWTGRPADKPTIDPIATLPNDGLDRDLDSSIEQWVSLEDHLADVEAEMVELLDSLGLSDHAFSSALIVAARWHDWGKSLDRWQSAVSKHVAGVRAKLEKLLQDPAATQFHATAEIWLKKMCPPPASNAQWAKFPGIQMAWKCGHWTEEERAVLRKYIETPFTPELRHEAASALGAWDAWLRHEIGLTALAVFLIASHHGKVRTALRSRTDNDDTFGLMSHDTLLTVPGQFESEAPLHFEAKRLGAHGEWSSDGTQFHWLAPSWAEMVAELLGPVEPATSVAINAIPVGEPRSIGPMALAYLEAILRTADARASRMPGKGGRR